MANALDHKEHPIYTRACWQSMTTAGITKLGYWNWVANTVTLPQALQPPKED